MVRDFDLPLSVLDLSPIHVGGSAAESFRNTLDLAQHAERWGYRRFWLAEHHGIPGVASAATAVLVAHVAGGTTSIRVGSLNHFERIARVVKVQSINTGLMDEFIAKRQREPGMKPESIVSPFTVSKDLRHIKAALNKARDWGYLPEMPKSTW